MALEFSDSNLGRIGYEREVEFGVLNSPFDEQIARVTSSSLAANKETVTSDELRSDRMVGDLIETAFTSGGDLGMEFSLGGTWDDFLESLICGTYAGSVSLLGNVAVTAATQNVADAGAGGTVFANAVVGQSIYITGMTNEGNNGWHQITGLVDSDSVTVATLVGTLTDETTASGSATIAGKMLKNPSDPANIVKRSYNLEQYFTDVDIAQLLLGQRLGTASLSTASNSIVNGSWTFLGTSVQVQEALGDFADTTVAPTCTDVVGATSNVAKIVIDGVQSTCLVQMVDLNVDNNLRAQNAIGSKFPCGIGYGRQMITGSITVYFQDLTTYNMFLNHEDASLVWAYVDNDGNALQITLPRVKFATDTPSLDGIDTDVVENMDFQAIESGDCATGNQYQIQIDIANVPTA